MNKLYEKWIGVGLFCLFLVPVYAQNTKTLSVKESIALGLQHNFGVRAASAEVDAAEAAHEMAKTARLPVIRGQASYMRLSDNIPDVDFSFPGTDTTYTLLPVEINQFHSEVSVRQPLFAGGRLNRQVEAAAHYADAASLLEEQEKVDVAFEVRKAYWELYQAMLVRDAVKTSLQMIDQHVRDIRNKVDEGTMLRADLLNAEVRRSEILLEQVEARNRVKRARLSLNRLTGQPPESSVTLEEPAPPKPVSFTMEDLVERTLRQRPRLHALSEQVSARETEVMVTKSSRLPELSLVGRYIYARPNQYFFAGQDEFHGTWEAGMSLQWDIWSGGKRRLETVRAEAQLRGMEARLADLKEQAALEVAQYYLELRRATEAIDVSTANVQSAREALRMVRNQFDEGMVLSTQVLDAEYALRKAEASYARAIADYKIARASVLHATGQIWDNDEF